MGLLQIPMLLAVQFFGLLVDARQGHSRISQIMNACSKHRFDSRVTWFLSQEAAASVSSFFKSWTS